MEGKPSGLAIDEKVKQIFFVVLGFLGRGSVGFWFWGFFFAFKIMTVWC